MRPSARTIAHVPDDAKQLSLNTGRGTSFSLVSLALVKAIKQANTAHSASELSCFCCFLLTKMR